MMTKINRQLIAIMVMTKMKLMISDKNNGSGDGTYAMAKNYVNFILFPSYKNIPAPNIIIALSAAHKAAIIIIISSQLF